MVKVYYGSLQTQSSSMSSVSQSRVSGFQSMISAFSNFASSNGELNGQGYDAARAYASGIMIPYYQACILYSEGVADAANTLADDYSAKCGAEDLDEEKLRAEIESASRGCMALSASISGIQSKRKPAEGDAARISSLQSQLAAAETRVREAQEKLDNLLEFSSQSQMACNAANRYWLAVSKGLEGISASFSGGGFAFPSDVSWVSVVEQGWADREIHLANAYATAMEKVYNGEDLTETDLTAIERYAAEYPGYVDTSVLAHVQEVRAVKAEEMKYRNLINKAEINGSLSDEEIQTLKAYEQKYPEGILLGQVREVLYDNELRVQKIQREKEDAEKAVSEVKKSVNDGENISKAIDEFLKKNFPGLDEELRNNLIGELVDKGDELLANNPTVVRSLQRSGLTWELIKQLKAYALGLETPPVGIGANLINVTTEVVETAEGPALQSSGSTIIGRTVSTGLGVGLAAWDYQSQINDGADVEDAAIKTAAHVGIGIAGAKAGAAIGTIFGPAGTVVGGVLGFAGGSLFSWIGSELFDSVYDEHIEPVVEDAKNYIFEN